MLVTKTLLVILALIEPMSSATATVDVNPVAPSYRVEIVDSRLNGCLRIESWNGKTLASFWTHCCDDFLWGDPCECAA